MTGASSGYTGLLYRALNPLYAQDSLSGAGAALHGGRFNKVGRAALYVTLNIKTAILEINQVGTLQPTTLVSYQADVHDIFDATNRAQLEKHKLSADVLASTTWRDEMYATGLAQTQSIAEDLIAQGYRAIKVPSCARGAQHNDINLVIWFWNDGINQLSVIDDEKRL